MEYLTKCIQVLPKFNAYLKLYLDMSVRGLKDIIQHFYEVSRIALNLQSNIAIIKDENIYKESSKKKNKFSLPLLQTHARTQTHTHTHTNKHKKSSIITTHHNYFSLSTF